MIFSHFITAIIFSFGMLLVLGVDNTPWVGIGGGIVLLGMAYVIYQDMKEITQDFKYKKEVRHNDRQIY